MKTKEIPLTGAWSALLREIGLDEDEQEREYS
jgi:hypothetical protein